MTQRYKNAINFELLNTSYSLDAPQNNERYNWRDHYPTRGNSKLLHFNADAKEICHHNQFSMWKSDINSNVVIFQMYYYVHKKKIARKKHLILTNERNYIQEK